MLGSHGSSVVKVLETILSLSLCCQVLLSLNAEEHWLAKKEEKTGMRLLREEGQTIAYCDRGANRRTTREWDPFSHKSKSYKDLERNFDIVRRINENG